MGCSDSRMNSEDEDDNRRNSAVSWAGPGSLDWETLFNRSSFHANVRRDSNGILCGQMDRVVKVNIPRPQGEKITRNYGDGLLGIRGNAATADMLSLLGPGELFSDSEFGAKCGSLYYDCSDDIEWKRASQISSQPQLLVKGIESSDVKAGMFQNMWFLQPLAAISQHPELIKKIVPEFQPLFGEDYNGMVKINFWRFGDWVTVYVSDSLPATEDNELMFASSEDTDEFWVALVEKAYAKLHGCYEAIEFGNPVDALIDLTGALVERYRIRGLQPLLYHNIARAVTSGSVVTCIRKGDWEATFEDLQRAHQEKQRLRDQQEEEEAAKQKEEEKEADEDDETASNKGSINDDDRLSLKSFSEDNATAAIDDVESGLGSRQDDAASVLDSARSKTDELEEVITTTPDSDDEGSDEDDSDVKCTLCGENGHFIGMCPVTHNEDGEEVLHDGTVDDETAEIIQPDMAGLIPGNMYVVTDVRRIARVKGAELLIRLKNPWEEGEEWTGAWCDGDYRWELVSKDTKKTIDYQDKEDGEFWMNYSDFCKHFKEVMICSIPKPDEQDGEEDEGFADSQYCYGKWVEGISAGGCRNDIESFITNPQFELQVFEADTSDPTYLDALDYSPRRTCNVVVSLMQDYRRTNKEYAIEMLSIGFSIYDLDSDDRRVFTRQLKRDFEHGMSGPHRNTRDVTGRFELRPGRYAIIPSTYEAGQPGRFLLRVHSKQRVALSELPEYDREEDERNTAKHQEMDTMWQSVDEEKESGRGNDSDDNEKEDDNESEEGKKDKDDENDDNKSRSPSPSPQVNDD